MNIVNKLNKLLTLDILKIIVLIQSLVILYNFVKKRKIKMNIEGFAESIDAEALANLASLYQSGDFKVSNLTVTNKLTVNGDTDTKKIKITGDADITGVATVTGNTNITGNANIKGHAIIGPAFIGKHKTDNYAEFSHKDRIGDKFSFISSLNGSTIVNAPLNSHIMFRNNNNWKNNIGVIGKDSTTFKNLKGLISPLSDLKDTPANVEQQNGNHYTLMVMQFKLNHTGAHRNFKIRIKIGTIWNTIIYIRSRNSYYTYENTTFLLRPLQKWKIEGDRYDKNDTEIKRFKIDTR